MAVYMKAGELKRKIARGEPMKLIDVREREEIDADGVSVPGSEHMPMGKVFVEAAHGRLPKDETIVAICATGRRCAIIARELREKGYDIEPLEGGLKAWDAEIA